MGLNLHFFHGFLGNTQDWSQILSGLDPKNFEVFCHDLFQDCTQNEGIGDFDSWAQYKNAELAQLENKNILVGYSLGGRLAMHLDPQYFDKLFLIGAHMGLREGKKERLASDQKWLEKSKAETVESWLKVWNSQEVFQKDRNRPTRSLSEAELSQWLKILLDFSLGKQGFKEKWVQENRDKIFWGCGSEDQKFMALKQYWDDLLGEDHCFEVPGSGHGVLFDNPKALSNKILEVLGNDL